MNSYAVRVETKLDTDFTGKRSTVGPLERMHSVYTMLVHLSHVCAFVEDMMTDFDPFFVVRNTRAVSWSKIVHDRIRMRGTPCSPCESIVPGGWISLSKCPVERKTSKGVVGRGGEKRDQLRCP